MAFVDVFDAAGKPAVIPEHWLFHPVLGRGYALTVPTQCPPPPVGEPKPARRKRSGRNTTPTFVAGDTLAPAAGDTEQESDPRC
jgi:hypothetical protein